ncbi:hypothetical protein RR48_04638 [Papilio machaon]|uniref:Anoctamin n=1 Tax=Papilio machaon TaxID=76193 RepID=A0A0N1IAC1_PAPMA|nr:hypothetical protein RR48_04638 [Papilio machaon]
MEEKLRQTDFVNRKLSNVLTDVENHRTYAAHESSYIWKLIIFNALCYTFLIIFSAYFVVFGHWFRGSGKPTLLDDIKFMNCGPYGCGDEMTVIVVVFGHWDRGIGKPTILRVVKFMNCGPYGCGDEMTVIVVVIVFMKEILGKLPWQVMPYHAHHMVKGCRRPLVRNSTGIGAWQQVIIAVGYAVPLFNPGVCTLPIMYDKSIGVNRYWQPRRYKWWGILVATHATIIFALLVRWLITRCPKDIKETEAVDGVTSDSNESTVPLKNNPGRTFRDGVRKIDLILVMKDEENLVADPMKNKFLTNIVKTGLEIEFENGVLPIHKKLVFFKVHCPNDVLNNLGNAFGVKCVQIARAEHIMSNKERDWINLIRKEYTQPLQYSSLDRSLVVYMTLLNLPFGDRQNYIGLESCVILFYNWVGITNIFTRQPLNVVQEYFGPKIALYFTFYGLYNLFLTIATVAALIALYLALYKNEVYTNASLGYLPSRVGDRQAAGRKTKAKTLIFIKPYVPIPRIFLTMFWIGKEKILNWVWETPNKHYNRKQTSEIVNLTLLHNNPRNSNLKPNVNKQKCQTFRNDGWKETVSSSSASVLVKPFVRLPSTVLTRPLLT